MTEVIKTCDRCKKRVAWLYDIPVYRVIGYKYEIRNPNEHYELCEECAKELYDRIRKFANGEEIK